MSLSGLGILSIFLTLFGVCGKNDLKPAPALVDIGVVIVLTVIFIKSFSFLYALLTGSGSSKNCSNGALSLENANVFIGFGYSSIIGAGVGLCYIS